MASAFSMCAYVYVVIVVRRSLVAQNLFVALSAANVWVLLSMPEEMMSRYGGALWYVCIVAVMVAGVLAQLASIGYKVAIEKDWIVVIAGKDKSQLSSELKLCGLALLHLLVTVESFKQ